MKSLNRVFLMGHLGRPPELLVSKVGKSYCRLNIATHRSWKTSEAGSGEDETERHEVTDWHSVFVWGPLAERCCSYLRKGALVFVEGSLTYWQVAQSTEKGQYKNAIHGHEVKFLNTVSSAGEGTSVIENLDNLPQPPDHNAVAHPA
jgi:single-strand DNA-binding protein